MRDLGYTHAKIPTQPNTWLACKVYYDMGFRPTKQSLKESLPGWRIVESLIGRKIL